MSPNYKPVGGVERVALYPADAVVTALFSSEGCEVTLSGEAVEVELLEDKSYYEEFSENRCGATKITHRLNLIAEREKAKEWLAKEFLERASIEGVVAVISLCDGRQLLAGYSSHFLDEQPLHLESLITSSGAKLQDTPTATLKLIGHDREFSQRIL